MASQKRISRKSVKNLRDTRAARSSWFFLIDQYYYCYSNHFGVIRCSTWSIVVQLYVIMTTDRPRCSTSARRSPDGRKSFSRFNTSRRLACTYIHTRLLPIARDPRSCKPRRRRDYFLITRQQTRCIQILSFACNIDGKKGTRRRHRKEYIIHVPFPSRIRKITEFWGRDNDFDGMYNICIRTHLEVLQQ